MCYYTREITNSYTGKSIRVKCGHCPACLMEKAIKNVNLIKSTSQVGLTAWFLTLTYNNDSVPFIFKSDIDNFYPSFPLSTKVDGYEVPLYRDCDTRRVRASKDYSIYQKRRLGRRVIDCVQLSCPQPVYGNELNYLANQSEERIGVLYYKDIQLFFKRFRQNLNRKFNVQDKIQTFYCGEYGPKTHRPHFHVLVFIPTKYNACVRPAFDASWPYADMHTKRRACEIARNCASYVSSYVNGHIYLPYLLRESDDIKPKNHHSIHFGFGETLFSFSKVAEKVRRRDIEYTVQRIGTNGTSEVVSLSYPEYVLRRFFPKIKGYCRLAKDEIINLYANPSLIVKYLNRLEYDYKGTYELCHLQKLLLKHGNTKSFGSLTWLYNYHPNDSCDDLWTNYRRLVRARDYAISQGFDPYIFGQLVFDAWYLYDQYLLRCQYQPKDNVLDWFETYDNIHLVYDDYIRFNGFPLDITNLKSPTLYELFSHLSESDRCKCHRNPNRFPSSMLKTQKLEEQFKKAFKKSKVRNTIYSKIDSNF